MASTTQCMIVDDEPLAIEVLEGYIRRLNGFQLVGKCRNPVEAFALLQQHRVDLIFLDIQMPEMTGLELLKTLRNPPMVIITTAHREHALEGYDLGVVDYLLKPISFERFLKAVDKYQARKNIPVTQPVHGTINPVFIEIKADRKIYRIPLQDIIYVESMKDYLRIFTTHTKYITKRTLRDFLEELPGDQFMQIHRSYIASLQHITAFDNTMVEIGKRQLPIGRSYNREVMSVLNRGKL